MSIYYKTNWEDNKTKVAALVLNNLENKVEELANIEIPNIDKIIEEMKEAFNIVKGAIYTLEMFGGKGDGVTDDTMAFKRALQSTKYLELSGKTYLISETLYIPSNTTIKGQGLGVTKIKMKDGKNSNMVVINGSSEKAALLDLTLDHGKTHEVSSNRIATVKLNDNTSVVQDEHYLINNVIIEGDADYGVWLTKEIRETRLNNVFVRANNRVSSFLIEGSNNYIHSCIATRAKLDGFNIKGNNNKISMCRSFNNELSGFYINGCEFIQMDNCESKENGLHGLHVEECSYSQFTNILLNTNGRNKNLISSNLLLKNSRQDKFIITCNQSSNLNGDIKNQVTIDGFGGQHYLNVSTFTDNKSKIFNVLNRLGVIDSYIICNGVEIKPYIFELDMIPSQNNSRISESFRYIEYDNNNSLSDTSKLLTFEGYQRISGAAKGQKQGIKAYTQFIPCNGVELYYSLQYYTMLGGIEITPCYYDVNKEFISEGEKSSLNRYEFERDVVIKESKNIPARTAYISIKITCFNDNAGGKYESYIKSLRVGVF